MNLTLVIAGKDKTTFFNRLDQVIVKLPDGDSEKQLGHWDFDSSMVLDEEGVVHNGGLDNLMVICHPFLKIPHMTFSEGHLCFERQTS